MIGKSERYKNGTDLSTCGEYGEECMPAEGENVPVVFVYPSKLKGKVSDNGNDTKLPKIQKVLIAPDRVRFVAVLMFSISATH